MTWVVFLSPGTETYHWSVILLIYIVVFAVSFQKCICQCDVVSLMLCVRSLSEGLDLCPMHVVL